jgi:prefoldin alpha subunit
MENTQNYDREVSQFQYLREQRDLYRGQFEINSAALNNLLNIKVTLENFKELKEDEEILLPIGGMVNVKAILKETKKVSVYVSQDTVIEKSTEDAIEFIEKQIAGYNEQQKFLREQIQNLELNLESLNQSLQKRMGQR